MVGKLSVCALVVATTLAMAGTAEARFRKSNTLTNVSTHIIPNWNNSGSDVCFVHNSNNAPVSAVVSVFPTGTLVLEFDRLSYPVLLGARGDAQVFSWSPLLPAAEYCQVMEVR
jgi:hypothetical protein